jgi:hypothetical protein
MPLQGGLREAYFRKLCEMGPRDFHLDAMMGACGITKLTKSATTRYVPASSWEMAKPRMARSATITELNLDTARISEQPNTMAGTVEKIIPSSRPSQPEKAQIAVDAADPRYRDHLRI